MSDGFAEMITGAIAFFERLKANNTKAFYEEHKLFYRDEIKKPAELMATFSPKTSPGHRQAACVPNSSASIATCGFPRTRRPTTRIFTCFGPGRARHNARVVLRRIA
jgi:hypothetical protein